MNGSTSKSAILSRIRSAIGVNAEQSAVRDSQRTQEWSQIAREYRRKGTLPPQERITLLQAILKHYGATSYIAEGNNVAEVIAQVLRQRQKQKLVVPQEFPREWIPPGI